MRILTEDAVLHCKHVAGIVKIAPSQRWVTVEGRSVLVDPDPEDKGISGCPNIGATIKPCLKTFKVQEGYSLWLRIEGRRICLDRVTGLTDGTPPGTVKYEVAQPGQNFVSEVS
jgi:hypothetical protein